MAAVLSRKPQIPADIIVTIFPPKADVRYEIQVLDGVKLLFD
jgi:hypothetical protein